ncbi:MAG: FecR domain-containing protein [Spirochaetes bacterium]|nr:FecR domain-containing protein [Spirochaetota bacterium]
MIKKIFIVFFLILQIIILNCKKQQDTVVANQGFINFTIGDVMLKSNGSEQIAKIGDVIKEGMFIITKGDKSQAEIFFGDNIIKVLGNTNIEVKKLLSNITKNSSDSEFFVHKGAVFSKVKKLGKNDTYFVKSPTATAGVRGTEFLVEEEGGKASIACIDGKVECINNSNPSDSTIIEKNEEAVVIPGQNIVKQQISADRLNMLNIIRNFKEVRDDIRKQYEKAIEDIRKQYEDAKRKYREDLEKVREEAKAAVEDQRARDKAAVEDQKARDKATIDAAKGVSQQAAKEAVAEAGSQMSAAKDSARKESATSGVQDQINQMKQLNKSIVTPKQ